MNLKIMDSKPTKTQQGNSVETIQTTERILECKAFGREWIIRIVPVFWFIMSLIIILTTSLGLWQLDRMHQKAATLEKTQTQQTQKVSGYFLATRLYLDNITYNGRVGYEIIVPFSPIKGESNLPSQVLVNLGWVAADRFRSQLPDVSINTLSVQRLMIQPASWSQRTPSQNIEVMHQASQPANPIQTRSLQNHVQQNSAQQNSVHQSTTHQRTMAYRIQALNVETQSLLNLPQTFFRALSGDNVFTTEHWQQQADNLEVAPKRHLGYAIQWFTMAVIAVIILLVSSISIVRPFEGDDGHE